MKDETEIRDRGEAGDAPGGGNEAAAVGSADADEAGAGADGAGEDPSRSGAGEEVAAEVEELRAELASLNDQHLRLAAEFDNYRKRNERERQALATRLQADIVASLLDVVDDLERVAGLGAETETAAVLEGVRLVEKKLHSVLQAAGLEVLEVEGERFDPESMEALMTVPTGDPEKDERVADVFQRGYRFRETLVRPARVRVWQYDESEASD